MTRPSWWTRAPGGSSRSSSKRLQKDCGERGLRTGHATRRSRSRARSEVALDAQTAFPDVLRSGGPEEPAGLACSGRDRNGNSSAWVNLDVEHLGADLEALHRRPDRVGADAVLVEV